MKNLQETLPRQSKIEFEKYNTKIILEFLGGVGNKEKGVSLTGSATKLTIIKPNGEKIVGLIDFGMFQGCENELKYNEILPFDLSEIDFSIITHTHLDHIGKLLHLSKNEFNGTIWTNKINKEILPIMLQDVIKLQPENPKTEIEKVKSKIKTLETARNNLAKSLGENSDGVQQLDNMIDEEKEKLKKAKKEGEKKQIYFETKDLIQLMHKINSVGYYEKVEVSNDIQLSFIKAGHLPGSSQTILKIKAGNGKYITIGFSGDIGKFQNPAPWGKPDITKERLDLYMIESTYAGRFHPEFSKEEEKIVKAINETIKKGGRIIIPVFMQGRAQEIGLFLNELIRKKKIPNIPIYYHSKSIEKITDIYLRYIKDFKKIRNWNKAITGVGKNKQLNFEKEKKSAILIASGGMMNGGTINNYLHYLQDPKNLFISSGYQAEGTNGHEIFTKQNPEIEIPGLGKIPINAQLLNFRGFSGHGDEKDLLQIISKTKFTKNAKIIINHGENTPEQLTFGLAIKGIVGRTKQVLFAEFDESCYNN